MGDGGEVVIGGVDDFAEVTCPDKVGGDGFGANVEEEANGAEAQLSAISKFFADTGGDALSVNPGAVAAVEVSDGEAITSDAEEAVPAADLGGGEAKVAF
jgi:hypothetical protein